MRKWADVDFGRAGTCLHPHSRLLALVEYVGERPQMQECGSVGQVCLTGVVLCAGSPVHRLYIVGNSVLANSGLGGLRHMQVFLGCCTGLVCQVFSLARRRHRSLVILPSFCCLHSFQLAALCGLSVFKEDGEWPNRRSKCNVTVLNRTSNSQVASLPSKSYTHIVDTSSEQQQMRNVLLGSVQIQIRLHG